MEHTLEASRLPSATREIAVVRDLCGSIAFEPIEPEQCKQDVLLHLIQCNILHFAGHDSTHPSDPSQSFLLLRDWKKTKLTVADLLEVNLRKHAPFFAYLSACGTGEARDKRLYDENIHLIRAYQLAGFRHVVGTL
jgi:CHAT domain-containing protein